MDQYRNKRLKCCDGILSYGFLFSGINLLQRSYLSSNIEAQFSTLSKSQDPLSSYMRWLIYTNTGRLYMMDVFCMIFSFFYFVMKMCIQVYFPSQNIFLSRLMFAQIFPTRIHLFFTKIYCFRVFLGSQFDCYLVALILGIYMLCVGVMNLIEKETSKFIQQFHNTTNASALERAKQEIEILSQKVNKVYPMLCISLGILSIVTIFFFYKLGVVKLFLLTYLFLSGMCIVVVNLSKFRQQMLRHQSENALEQFNRNFTRERLAGITCNLVNLLAIVLALFQINFSVIEVVPFAFICLQSFKANLRGAYIFTKSYFQFQKLFSRFNTECSLVKNDRDTECPICLEPMAVGRKLPCQHMFHQFCLLELINTSNFKCPMCRESFIETEQLQFRPNEYIRLNGRRFCRLLPDITIRFVRSIRPHNQVYYQMRNLFPQIPGHQVMAEMRNHPNIEELVQRLTAIAANQNAAAGQPQDNNPQLPMHQPQQAAPLAGDVAPIGEEVVVGEEQQQQEVD